MERYDVSALLIFLLTMIIIPTNKVLVDAAAAHDKTYRECKDHSHFNCHLIAEKGDCDELSATGKRIGESFCQVSCGKCDYSATDGDDEVYTGQSCYPFGKQEIQVSFFNQNPQNDDWLGMYPAAADSNNLGSPVAWYWLCGGKKDTCKTGVGTVKFPWLPPGVYKAVMIRHGHSKTHGGPYSSYAESEPFEVVRGNTCTSRRLEDSEIALVEEKNSYKNNNGNLRGVSLP
jgi:hypothetical protein